MTHSLLPALTAVLVTVVVGAAMHVAEAANEVALPFLGMVAAAAFLAPLGLPVLWSWALLKGRPLQLTAGIVVIGLGGLMALFPGDIGGHLVSYAVVGLLAAFGLLSRWRPGLIVVAMCGVMIPIVVASTDLAMLDEMFAEQKEQTLQARREMLMAEQGEGASVPALTVEEEALEQTFGTLRKLIPGVIASGIIFQSVLAFWLISLLAGRLRLGFPTAGLPSFGRWRFPFTLVWLLALGVGLMVARRQLPGLADWPPVGVNLVLVMVCLAAVQGAAVQWRLSPRTMPRLARLILLFMAGFLFLPLVFLGLADQWLDFRKLDTDGPVDRDDSGGDDDAPADKQGG